MSSTIKIKRSSSTRVPANLSFGELAFTANGDLLYVGYPNSAPVAIGGKRNPGVLTANQALVANSTGFIDQIKTSVLQTTRISANGTFGTDGQVLVSGGTSNAASWKTLGVTNYDSLVLYISTYIPYTPNTNDFVLIQPVLNNMTLQQNFTNCIAYAEVPATTNAVFSIYNGANLVGNATFLASQTNGVFTATNAYSFVVGEKLKIKCMTAQDATLQDFTISLMFIKDTA